MKALLVMVRLFIKLKWLGLMSLKAAVFLSGLVAALAQLLPLFDRLSGPPLR